MAYTVVRTDAMSGTMLHTALENGRYYDTDGAFAEIENGSIVQVGALETGERESHVYTDVKAEAVLSDLVVLAAPEIFIDETPHKGISDFINQAGECIRGYRLLPNDEFSVSAEGFDGTVPEVGGAIGVATGTHKLSTTATDVPIGVCTSIETHNYYPLYTIKIGK